MSPKVDLLLWGVMWMFIYFNLSTIVSDWVCWRFETIDGKTQLKRYKVSTPAFGRMCVQPIRACVHQFWGICRYLPENCQLWMFSLAHMYFRESEFVIIITKRFCLVWTDPNTTCLGFSTRNSRVQILFSTHGSVYAVIDLCNFTENGHKLSWGGRVFLCNQLQWFSLCFTGCMSMTHEHAIYLISVQIIIMQSLVLTLFG